MRLSRHLLPAAAPNQGAAAISEAPGAAHRDVGITVLKLDEVAHIACDFDGAAEIDADFAVIKGGGPASVREKFIAGASGTFIHLIDASKQFKQSGAFALPVDAIPQATHRVVRRLPQMGQKRPCALASSPTTEIKCWTSSVCRLPIQ